MHPRAFTVAEAEAMLPLLEGVLREMDRQREEAARSRDRLQVLELLWGDALRDPRNPDHAEGIMAHAAMIEAAREIQRLVQREIVDRGIRFPSGGLEHGLLDFPTLWQGRWVFLCWQRGEPGIVAWHELDAGYAGRQPLTPPQRAGMGTA